MVWQYRVVVHFQKFAGTASRGAVLYPCSLGAAMNRYSNSRQLGDPMATHKVNLDALITRENFESSSGSSASLGNEPLFKVEELAKGKLYYSVLRKPDFQRQTNNWTPEMVVDFVQSFLDAKLIPSIIIWHSMQTGKVFVVDGAHRVSALIAWVNDDYGDGVISRERFSYISPAQAKFHKITKAMMDERVGDFQRMLHIGLNPEGADPAMVRRARSIATRQPSIQKVEGDATIAEESFLKINSNPAIIDRTELDVIRARRKPNAIATRALIGCGAGQGDWAKFPRDKAKVIEETAKIAHDFVFGQFYELTSTSADIPRAGQPYSQEAFQMVLDMVNVFNEVTPAMWQQQADGKKSPKGTATVALLPDDANGDATLAFLERVKNIGRLVADNDYPGSLGLDQAVYSYGATGRFHPAAFLASLRLAHDLKEKNKCFEFTSVRKDFEEFLVRHKRFINALTHSKGSRTRALESIVSMHWTILDSMFSDRCEDKSVIGDLLKYPKFKSLKDDDLQMDDEAVPKGKKFSKTAQAVALVRDVLANRERCTVCGARVPPHSRSKDHIVRAEDGGTSSSDNLAFTHPYCNTGYKERVNSQTFGEDKGTREKAVK
jgi:hypothetical protein